MGAGKVGEGGERTLRGEKYLDSSRGVGREEKHTGENGDGGRDILARGRRREVDREE